MLLPLSLSLSLFPSLGLSARQYTKSRIQRPDQCQRLCRGRRLSQETEQVVAAAFQPEVDPPQSPLDQCPEVGRRLERAGKSVDK